MSTPFYLLRTILFIYHSFIVKPWLPILYFWMLPVAFPQSSAVCDYRLAVASSSPVVSDITIPFFFESVFQLCFIDH